jgi:hypothetical protein
MDILRRGRSPVVREARQLVILSAINLALMIVVAVVVFSR